MRHTIFVLVLFACSFFVYSFLGQNDSNKTISPEEVRGIVNRRDTAYTILDVRTKAEYESETGHIPGAMLIPLDELEKRYIELLSVQEKELIVYCRSGRRSTEASRILAGKGFRIRTMEGGILRWNSIQKK
jgi:rhodanese-related sulfurtransferase